MNTTDLRIGSQVLVESGFGVRITVRGIVTGIYEGIEKGKPEIDYVSESDSGRKADHWAYLSQVREIEKY